MSDVWMCACGRLSKPALIVPNHAALMHAYPLVIGGPKVSAQIVAIEQPHSSAPRAETAL
jgi:hypothetical protein